MARKNRVIFTDNKQSDRGIMSVILGSLCAISLLYCIITSYRLEGEVPERFGGALVVTLVFALTGLALGIVSRMDTTKFKLLPTIGIIINGLETILLGFLLWIGLR